MILYRSLRQVALALRSAQTALLGASFFVSDCAHGIADSARAAADKSLDRELERGYTKVDNLFQAAEFAQARAEDAADEHALNVNDINERRRLIELEVL